MAVGQELGGFYKQSIHPEGLLYFIFPQQMPASKNRKSIGKKALSYDYTYLDSRDSVTLLMTMNTTEPFIPDSLIISENGKNPIIKRNLTILYVEAKGKHWVARTKAQMAFEEWIYLYSCKTPPQYIFTSKEKALSLIYSNNERNWKKISGKFQKIQELIKINRIRKNE